MFESVNTKFPDLKCIRCGAELPLNTPCRVQTDVSGWLMYAECLGHPEQKIDDPRSNAIGWAACTKEAKAGSTVHALGCDCGFCKAGYTN